MRRHAKKIIALTLTAVALGFAPGLARASSTNAQGFIQGKQAQVTDLLRKPASSSRDQQIASVLDGMLDYDRLARESLSQHWSSLDGGQQKDFTELLKKLVQRNYERNIKNIQGYAVEYLGESPSGSSVIVVKTRAASKTNAREQPVEIDYRLEQTGDAYRVFDIVTEGSSLVSNYRSQFNRIIRKDGYDALVKRLQDKLAQGEA